MRLLLLPVPFLLALPAAVAAPEPPKLRLPDGVKPLGYSLDLTLIPEQDTFSGIVQIDIDLARPTELIWLHAAGLRIGDASLARGGRQHAARVVEGGTEFAGFQFDAPVPAGKARLRIAYRGELSRKASGGMFKLTEGGAAYIFTQFEPIDARRAFPCFDEPQFKVPWQVTIHTRRELAAVANTPVVAETDEPDGRKAVRFAPSKPMPSYLVALAVGPFDFVDAGRAGKGGTKLRIITPRGKRDEAAYAAQIMGPILDKLEDYFGIPYPFEKLDSIAMPLTFGFGAMENAGLITYGSSILLSDAARDTVRRQRNLFSVAVHEIAHQWFGNLVTMQYWNDIWLNEGFASWMEAKITAQMHPEWRGEAGEQTSRLSAMREDSLVSARRIRQPIESNDDIANGFDGITYEKGQAVLGAFERWVGPENFRRGVQQYLRRHAWRNAASGDFLDSLGSASRQGVTRAFSTFLEQAGVPLLSVRLECDAARAPALVLSQQRFRKLGSPAQGEQRWEIPVCVKYTGAGGAVERECLLLDSLTAQWKLPRVEGCPAWVQANADGGGYYRVRYEGDLMNRLLDQGAAHLSAAERISLAGNAEALAAAGQMKAGEALALAARLAGDPEREVVTTATRLVRSLREILPEELVPHYRRFVSRAFGERARQLGWVPRPGEDADTALLRADVVPWVTIHGDEPELAAEAKALAARWLEDRKALDPNLVQPVLAAAARHGGRDLFDRLLSALRSASDRTERRQLINGLGSFSDPALTRDALALLLRPEFDLREAMGILFGPARAAGPARHLPFQFLRENFEALVARMPTGTSFDMGAGLPFLANACNEAGRKQAEEFFAPRMARFAGGPRNLAQRLEEMSQCIAFRAAQGDDLAAFLHRY